MPEPISIVIPAFNQLEYCRQCVHAIIENTGHPYRLILVNNGSTDGVGEFFDSVAGADVVHSDENLGFAGGVNLGMARAEGHVLLLNSDTLTPRGWLTRLASALESDGAIGMCGPMSNSVSGSQLIPDLSFEHMDEINGYAASLAAEHGGRVRDVARLVGFCLLIRDRCVSEVGRFDEDYGIGNFEDDDYCLRALRRGYRLCVAEGAFVFHYGNRTFLGMGLVDDAWRELIGTNEARFQEKWDARPEERIDAVQASRQWNRGAREARQAGDFAEAVRCYTEAIRTAPAYDLNYNDLGVLLWEQGDCARAYEQFSRALRRNPASEDARENLLGAAAALGREDDARTLLDALIPPGGGKGRPDGNRDSALHP